MAFVVPTKRGRFEIRESRSTPKGPRSRTLVSFTELTDEVVERAGMKAAKPLSATALRSAARRAGAPLQQDPADRAARELIAAMGRGKRPQPKLRRLAAAMLTDSESAAVAPADPGRAVAEWIAATPQQRGKALFDLLELADALPHRGRLGRPLTFPRLDSGPA